MKRIKFHTLGCKVNQYETQRMREEFSGFGFEEPINGEPVVLYVINTCTVTNKADRESLSLIRRARKENPKAGIIVTGCLTELDEDKIKSADKDVIIVKNMDKEDILRRHFRTFCQDGSNETGKPVNKGISYLQNHTRVFLKVQDGCNNFCSYCKVPLVRGPSRSRSLSSVIEEAKKIIDGGAKEIVLTGICLGDYGKDLFPKKNLVELIKAISGIDGFLRIRLSSIEAKDITGELISQFSNEKKLCRHLHIPLQSGDNGVLKEMNRRDTREDYASLVNRVKSEVPGIAITTDVIVGFPGEDEGGFNNTLNLIREIEPLKVHVFPYSKRPGTAICLKPYRFIPPKIIERRLKIIRDTSERCSLNFRKKFIGEKLWVLIEEELKEGAAIWTGYTDNYIKVMVRSKENLKNHLVYVRLKDIEGEFLFGNIN